MAFVSETEKKPKKRKRRGPGEGSITQRPDGRWMIQISAIDQATGERKRITDYAKTHKEAKDILVSLQANIQNGVQVIPNKTLFGAWVDNWMVNYKKIKVKRGTYEIYEGLIKTHIKPSIGHHPLSKLTTSIIQEFYVLKLKTHAISTVHLMHNIINSSLKQALKEGLVQRNVSEATVLPSVVREEVKPLPIEEVDKFLLFIQNDRLYPAFALELVSGMRRGELLALTWPDINMDTGTCKITKALIHSHNGGSAYFAEPKTKSSIRTITLPKQVLDILSHHKAQQAKEKLLAGSGYSDNKLIFCSETGQPLVPKRFSYYFQTLLKQANIQKVPFHNLRHTVASALLRKGKSMKAAQALLGHSTLAMTSDTYSHMVEEIKQETAETLGSTFFSKKSDCSS